MWTNETECGIHVTRFIMSWVRMGGSLRTGRDYHNFEAWLKTLIVDGKNLSDQDVNHILDLSKNGKMELEHLAKEFLNNPENYLLTH